MSSRECALREARDAQGFEQVKFVAYDGEARVKVGREFLLKKD